MTLHEADWVAHVCDPAVEAWTRLLGVLEEYSRLNGIDLFVGRRLPRLLRDAGLADVCSHAIIHAYEPGQAARLSGFLATRRV